MNKKALTNQALHNFVHAIIVDKINEWLDPMDYQVEINDVPELIGDEILKSKYNQDGLHAYGVAYFLEDNPSLVDVLSDTLNKVVNKDVVAYAVNYDDWQDGFVYITIVTKE